MKLMLLSFIFSSLLYVNLFAAGCCSSCNSCKKRIPNDLGKYKPELPLIITNDDIKLNNNVIQPISVDNIPDNIVSDEYKSNTTFYKLTEEQFNSNIIPTVDLGNDTQYIITKIKTNEDRYYLLKIIIKDTGKGDNHTFKASKVFFAGAISTVTKIIIIDSSKCITSLDRIFAKCNNLVYVDLSNLNTQNVTNMSSMFYGCNSLTSLNLSKFNTQNVTSMNIMFFCCDKLENIYITETNNADLITAVKKRFGEVNSNYDKETKCIIIKKSK